MADPQKRLMYLEKVTREGATDPMAWYGLALEYKNAARVDDALRTFEALREKNVDYVPAYLMCGQMLAEAGRKDEARSWLENGIVRARATGNSHALGEMESALAGLDA